MKIDNIELTILEESILLYVLENTDIHEYNELYHKEDIDDIIDCLKEGKYKEASNINKNITSFVLKYCLENTDYYNKSITKDNVLLHGESLCLKVSKIIGEKVIFKDF